MTDKQEDVRRLVREGYGAIAESGSCCGPQQQASGCCGTTAPRIQSELIGYQALELDSVPDDVNLGLGCGNPTVLASLKPGEIVIDLGAGPGLDAFLAAKKVGSTGRVIGIDMTPEMLERARKSAAASDYCRTVEFREGIIESLPVVSDSADVIISNCVINLSPDKPQVFKEAFRVLRSGGRIAVTDILLTEPLPEEIRSAATAYVACLAGAITEAEYLGAIKDAGFVDIQTSRVPAGPMFEGAVQDPAVKDAVGSLGIDQVKNVLDTVYSYKIEARKP